VWIVSHVQVIDDGSTDADTRPEPPTDIRLACKLEKVDHAPTRVARAERRTIEKGLG